MSVNLITQKLIRFKKSKKVKRPLEQGDFLQYFSFPIRLWQLQTVNDWKLRFQFFNFPLFIQSRTGQIAIFFQSKAMSTTSTTQEDVMIFGHFPT